MNNDASLCFWMSSETITDFCFICPPEFRLHELRSQPKAALSFASIIEYKLASIQQIVKGTLGEILIVYGRMVRNWLVIAGSKFDLNLPIQFLD